MPTIQQHRAFCSAHQYDEHDEYGGFCQGAREEIAGLEVMVSDGTLSGEPEVFLDAENGVSPARARALSDALARAADACDGGRRYDAANVHLTADVLAAFERHGLWLDAGERERVLACVDAIAQTRAG